MYSERMFGSYRDETLGRVYVAADLRIEPAQLRATGQTIEHEPIAPDAAGVAISGESWYKARNGSRMDLGFGQNIDDLRRVKTTAAQRVAELWDRWHLNGLRANCAHMGTQDCTPGLACPVTGYESGSAWLYEPVPDAVLVELVILFGKQPGNIANLPASARALLADADSASTEELEAAADFFDR